MGLRKAAMLKLTAQAQEIEAGVRRGKLTRDPSGIWMLDSVPLSTWLQEFEGHELVLIIGALDDERAAAVRTCSRCGRDYTDPECPHCQEARQRLRPRWKD